MAVLLPLDKRTIPVANKNGLHKDAPAIHRMWSQNRSWTGYQLPPDKHDSEAPGAVDAWLASAKRTLSDLSWLLRLQCYKFWSQICSDDGLHMWLGELLEIFPREHDRDSSWHPRIKELNSSILQKLFLVHVRLCTYKESASDFFNPEAWGHMIYDQYLLELPKILDMCILFGPCNKAITSKMVANLFKYQNKYMGDLLETGLTMEAALDSATEQFQIVSLSPPSLASLQGLVDLVTYSLDISVTLSSLVTVFPSASTPLHQTGLEVKLAMFYNNVITPLLGHVHKYIPGDVIPEEVHSSLVSNLKLARHNIILAVREILGEVCLASTLLKRDNSSEVMPHIVEEFLTVFTSVLSERSFLVDYDKLHPIREEFLMFEEFGTEMDTTRKHYILDALNPTQSSNFTSLVTAKSEQGGEKSKLLSTTACDSLVNDQQVAIAQGASALNNKPSYIEIDSMISTVRDLLPYLGEGFVERVLVEYDYKIDGAINALLESNLPPHLAKLDQNMPKEATSNGNAMQPQVQRSIYDEDEFDILNRDTIDTSRIHRGKKDKSKDAKKLLDDKRDLHGLKDRFDKLSIVVDVVHGESSQNDAEYEDEYDDTYDDHALGDQEPDADEEVGRAFVLPIALGGGKIKERIVDAEDDSDDDEESAPNTNMNFIRNPEEVRQEQERRRAEKMNRARKKGPPGGGGVNGVPPHRDVVGRAKGQGQEKHVLLARARKNANKGKGHRIGADKKASKGMF